MEKDARPNWESPMQFVLACVSYAVGLGMFGVFHICVKCMAEVRNPTTGGGSKECMFTITYDGKLIVILFLKSKDRKSVV